MRISIQTWGAFRNVSSWLFRSCALLNESFDNQHFPVLVHHSKKLFWKIKDLCNKIFKFNQTKSCQLRSGQKQIWRNVQPELSGSSSWISFQSTLKSLKLKTWSQWVNYLLKAHCCFFWLHGKKILLWIILPTFGRNKLFNSSPPQACLWTKLLQWFCFLTPTGAFWWWGDDWSWVAAPHLPSIGLGGGGWRGFPIGCRFWLKLQTRGEDWSQKKCSKPFLTE